VLALALALWHPGRSGERRYISRSGTIYPDRDSCPEAW